MQTITLKQVIRANKKALKEGTLGAIKNPGACQYVYEDGSRCAIGQVLNKATIKKITAYGASTFSGDFNSSTISLLLSEGIIEIEGTTLQKKLVAYIQDMHDAVGHAVAVANTSYQDLPAEFEALVGINPEREASIQDFEVVLALAEKYA